MKKALLALLALVLIVAVGLWVFWPQVRLMHMRLVLDRVLIPNLQAQYEASTGFKPEITYKNLRADGDTYEVDDLAMTVKGDKGFDLKSKTMVLDRVDFSLFSDQGSCDLAVRETVLEGRGFKFTVRNVELSGLKVDGKAHTLALKRKFVQDLHIEGPGLPKSLDIASVEATDYQIKLDPAKRTAQGSLGQVTAIGQSFKFKLDKVEFEGDIPRNEKGMPVYDKVQVRTGRMEVNTQAGPSMSIDSISATTSRTPDKSADQVAFKGLKVPTPPNGEAAKVLEELGLKGFSLDMTYDYSYDRPAKLFTIKQLVIDETQLGKLSLAFSLEDLDFDPTRSMQANQEAVMRSRPTSLALRFDDASLTDRVLGLLAKREGLGLEEYRAKVIKTVPPIPNIPTGQQVVRAFLQKPGSLCLTITPQKKLTLEELKMAGPQLVPLLLNWQLDDCAK